MKHYPGSAKTRSSLSGPVRKRLNMYALAATAGAAGALTLAQPAEAKIVYTPTHEVIGKDGYYAIDFNHDGTADVIIYNQRYCCGPFGGSFNRIGGFPNQLESAGVECVPGTNRGYFLESALMPGARIGAGGHFLQKGLMAGQCAHGTHSSAPPCSSRPYGTWGWANVKNRYLGVSFVVRGKTHYGWARLSVKLSRKPFKATVILSGYAYETIANKRIIAGDTKGPEAGRMEGSNAALVNPVRKAASLGLLALGAPGLSIWRREKSQQEP
jgi:hypothetical protein